MAGGQAVRGGGRGGVINGSGDVHEGRYKIVEPVKWEA